MKVIKIGRASNNDIIINDEKVSRNHLEIIQDDEGNFSIVDVGSSNGTFVNEQRITGEVKINPSDTIRIGSSILPWPGYFTKTEQTQPPSNKEPDLPQKSKFYIKSKLLKWAIAAIVVLGIGVSFFIFVKKDSQIQEQRELNEALEALIDESIDAEREFIDRKEFEELAMRAGKLLQGNDPKDAVQFIDNMKTIAAKYPNDQSLKDKINDLEEELKKKSENK